MTMKLPSLICAAALLAGTTFTRSEETPSPAGMMPKPVAQHEWLKKFVGEWEMTTECHMEPDKPPTKGGGTETVRSLGGFWIVADGKGEMMGSKAEYLMTLGFDPTTGKYIGTWVDSMTGLLWKYTGSVDETGKILTLESEGPSPMNPEKTTKFHDVTEFKSDDHRLFTSSVLGEDGKWVVMARGEAKRTK